MYQFVFVCFDTINFWLGIHCGLPIILRHPFRFMMESKTEKCVVAQMCIESVSFSCILLLSFWQLNLLIHVLLLCRFKKMSTSISSAKTRCC